MNFKTVYELATEKVNFFNQELPTLYLFFICGLGSLIFYNRNRKETKILILGIIFTIISSISVIGFLWKQVTDIRKANQIIKSKNFSIVEGTPQNYHPFPKDGHGVEEFDVGGVHFAYSDYIDRGVGYHHAASLGGVIVPNKYYRFTYYTLQDDLDSNKILKIEIPQ